MAIALEPAAEIVPPYAPVAPGAEPPALACRAEPLSLAAAFAECERIARTHYENFTLGSHLLPRHLRRHIAAIYAFARTADDLAEISRFAQNVRD